MSIHTRPRYGMGESGSSMLLRADKSATRLQYQKLGHRSATHSPRVVHIIYFLAGAWGWPEFASSSGQKKSTMNGDRGSRIERREIPRTLSRTHYEYLHKKRLQETKHDDNNERDAQELPKHDWRTALCAMNNKDEMLRSLSFCIGCE